MRRAIFVSLAALAGCAPQSAANNSDVDNSMAMSVEAANTDADSNLTTTRAPIDWQPSANDVSRAQTLTPYQAPVNNAQGDH